MPLIAPNSTAHGGYAASELSPTGGDQVFTRYDMTMGNALFPEPYAPFRIEDYRYSGTLGAGGEGQVYKFEQKKNSGKVVAVKTFAPNPNRPVPREVQMSQRLPIVESSKIHLAEYYYAIRDFPEPGRTSLVLNYYEGGDLVDLIHDNYHHGPLSRVPEHIIWQIYSQLSKAVNFLHQGPGSQTWSPLIHRDIKPANILVRHKPNNLTDPIFPDIVLADFGLATGILGQETSKHYGGTKEWQPPEQPLATPAGDIWATGAVIHWLATKECPMRSLTLEELGVTESRVIEVVKGAHPSLQPVEIPYMVWYAMHPRYPQHINQNLMNIRREESSHPWDWTPYSDELDHWMFRAFTWDPKQRIKSRELSATLEEIAAKRVEREKRRQERAMIMYKYEQQVREYVAMKDREQQELRKNQMLFQKLLPTVRCTLLIRQTARLTSEQPIQRPTQAQLAAHRHVIDLVTPEPESSVPRFDAEDPAAAARIQKGAPYDPCAPLTAISSYTSQSEATTKPTVGKPVYKDMWAVQHAGWNSRVEREITAAILEDPRVYKSKRPGAAHH